MLPVKQPLQKQTAAISPVEVLEESERALALKIDSEIEQLLENFVDLIKLSSVGSKDKYAIAQEQFQIETKTANIVRSVETCLKITAEQQKILLLNDHPFILKNCTERKTKLELKQAEIKSKMGSLKEEVNGCIKDLEKVLYNKK